MDAWSTCESIAQLKPVTTSATFLLPDHKGSQAGPLARPEVSLRNAVFENVQRKAAANAEPPPPPPPPPLATNAIPVPGRHMAQRAALKHSRQPNSPEHQACLTRRDGVLGGSVGREQVDPDVVAKILKALEEEELRTRPLPAQPALWEVLQGPRSLPRGLDRHVARMSNGRTRHLEKLRWMAQVDGKRPSPMSSDDDRDMWTSIVENRWKELDDMLA